LFCAARGLNLGVFGQSYRACWGFWWAGEPGV
jgi:hypothetical protein